MESWGFSCSRWWEHLSDVIIRTPIGRCFGKVNTESFTCNLTYANTNTLVFTDCWKPTEETTEELKHSCWMSPNSPAAVLHGGWALPGSTCHRIRSVSVADVAQAFSAPCSSSLFKGIDTASQLCWHLDVHVSTCAQPSRTTTALKCLVFEFYSFILSPKSFLKDSPLPRLLSRARAQLQMFSSRREWTSTETLQEPTVKQRGWFGLSCSPDDAP